MLGAHVVQVREVAAAQITLVEPLQGYVIELVGVGVWSSIRTVQQLLHEAPADESERVATAHFEHHLRDVVGDGPGPGRFLKLLAKDGGQVGSQGNRPKEKG